MAIGLDNAPLAFGLVFAAGFSTALGAAAVFEKRIVKMASKPVLGAGLGFSAGVMIYVSFIEIFMKSQDAFEADGRSRDDAYMCATVTFFAGMLMLRLISVLVHMIDSDHHCVCEGDTMDLARETTVNVPPLVGYAEFSGVDIAIPTERLPATEASEASEAADPEEAKDKLKKQREEHAAKHEAAQLQRMGINTAAAIAIHNFPEGLATFVATLADPSVGATLAIAIGIHNIPEGLCVALPIYYATGSRWKGFLWGILSGVSEPVGALIGYLVIRATGDDMNQLVYGILFGLVAGMMVMIVVLELLPTAYKYDSTDRFVTNCVVLGMVVMAASLCLFKA